MLVLLVLVLIALAWPTAAAAAPNVVVVVTDDQPYGTSKHLPFLNGRRDFAKFTEAHDNTALCCPARATLLTGLYSHHTRVEDNDDGWKFDDRRTLATWLNSSGYETGLFGKYLNRYPWSRGQGYVPPGWDQWAAYDGGYYNYTLVENGAPVHYGRRPQDYSTDVLRRKVVQFVASAPEPFFAYFAPAAPHLPFTPAPRHLNASDAVPVSLPPNFNRVSKGASRWWRDRERTTRSSAVASYRAQIDSLLSVDEALRTIMGQLMARGALGRTLILFLSDNGYSHGSHRLGGSGRIGKGCAYEECGHIPVHIRLPGGSGGRVTTPVSNVDLAPTILDVVGLSPNTDGRSLVPLLTGRRSSLNRPILLRGHREAGRLGYPPSYWGVRTARWKYIVERDRGVVSRDLFDLRADPFELRDLVQRPSLRSVRERLTKKMRRLRGVRD